MTCGSLRIVVADDDDGHATLIERSLRRAGLANPIVRVRDGQEALELLRGAAELPNETPPPSTLVLLDIQMPRLGGVETLRQLKADPRTASIPVIMLTTTDDPGEIELCYRLGCSVYVTKPVAAQQFLDAIRRLGLFLQVVQFPESSRGPTGASP